MPTTRAQFETRLTDSGIMSMDELRAFADSASDLPAGVGAGDDPGALARALVEAERLTSFQAEVLLAESAGPLRLGRYLLLDRVGSGGMGHVHKAIHERMNRIVALKVLPPLAAMDPGLVARFKREVEVAAKLHHPHIVTAYDADEADGVHFLVMELVEGRDLAEVVAEDGAMSVDEALACIEQAARALEYAHGEGVLHRDVKPANLLIDASGHVKVLDMGLARLESSEGLTTTGDVIGTAATMAPEQGDNTGLVDERSDVYGLGCTLYFLLSGRHMYEGDSALQVLLSHARDPVPALHETCPAASADLEALFESMVRKDREERLPNMRAVLDGIEALRAGEAPATPPTPLEVPVPVGQTPVGSRRWVAIAATLAAIGLALWLALGGADRTAPSDDSTSAVVPLVRTLRGHTGGVHAVLPHPDGRRLLSGSGDDTVGIWELKTGNLLGRLEGHDDSVRSVLCLRDGNTVITASDDTTIRIWDLESRSTRKILKGNASKVRKLALAPDETWFASAGKDGTLRIWDLPAGTERVQRSEHGPWSGSNVGLMGVVVRPDGNALATVAFDQTVRLWDTDSFELRKTLGPFGADTGAVTYTRDGAYLLYDVDSGPVHVVSADGETELHRLVGHQNWVYSIACARTHDLAATGSEDWSVRVWDLVTGTELALLEGHEFTVGALTFSLDDEFLISGSGDETIRLWGLSALTSSDD